MDATWRSGPCGSASQTARVRAWHIDDVYVYILLYYGYRTYKPFIEDIANCYNPVYLLYMHVSLTFSVWD